MTREEFFDRIAAHRPELARAGVRRLGVFGSVARNEAGQKATSTSSSNSRMCRISLSLPLYVNDWPKSLADQSISQRLRR